MYSKREQSAPAAELVIASATYWGQLVHDAGTASVHCPATVWWAAPLLHLIYPTYLEAGVSQIEGNRSGESSGTLSLVPSQSLGQKTNLFCGADQCSG